MGVRECVRACVRSCVRACVRACVCVCVCERERERERESVCVGGGIVPRGGRRERARARVYVQHHGDSPVD